MLPVDAWPLAAGCVCGVLLIYSVYSESLWPTGRM